MGDVAGDRKETRDNAPYLQRDRIVSENPAAVRARADTRPGQRHIRNGLALTGIAALIVGVVKKLAAPA